MKELLVTAPILAYPHFGPDREFSASGIDLELGAVLSQKQDDGPLHPIAYASQSLMKRTMVSQNLKLLVLYGL